MTDIRSDPIRCIISWFVVQSLISNTCTVCNKPRACCCSELTAGSHCSSPTEHLYQFVCLLYGHLFVFWYGPAGLEYSNHPPPLHRGCYVPAEMPGSQNLNLQSLTVYWPPTIMSSLRAACGGGVESPVRWRGDRRCRSWREPQTAAEGHRGRGDPARLHPV